jgi:hypothetical protein
MFARTADGEGTPGGVPSWRPAMIRPMDAGEVRAMLDNYKRLRADDDPQDIADAFVDAIRTEDIPALLLVTAQDSDQDGREAAYDALLEFVRRL